MPGSGISRVELTNVSSHGLWLLVDDEDMPRVAEATTDAASFLWELHREGRLRSGLQPLPLTHSPR
jgi:hypothetical protein